MDLNKIFMKNACPTKIGGQAILEGLMMRGSKALAIAIRQPNGNIHLSVEPVHNVKVGIKGKPIIRGVVSFIDSLITGTSILMYGADVLEKLEEEQGKTPEEPDKFDQFLEKHFGKDKAFTVAMYVSVVLAVLMSVGIFVLLPTVVMNLVRNLGLENVILLNLVEGVLRITIFVVYILLISKMPEIKRTFEYHGAEHKTIHCYENGLPLTAENAQQFYTLHPRCGTSFMMFVMIISLLVFSFLGWPDLKMRIISRLLFIPIIAGLSYELLQFTGRHNNKFVELLSMPGIMLQKLTTNEPSLDQLEVAIAAIKAVIPSHEDQSIEVDYWVGEVLGGGLLVKNEEETEAFKKLRTEKK